MLENKKKGEALYNIQVPGSSKHELSRTVATTPAIVPHEALAEESSKPGFYTALHEWATSPLPPAYREHPVVHREAAEGAPSGHVVVFVFIPRWRTLFQHRLSPRALDPEPCNSEAAFVLHPPQTPFLPMWMSWMVLHVRSAAGSPMVL